MYIVNYLRPVSCPGIKKKFIIEFTRKLGTVLFVIFPYIYVLTISVNGPPYMRYIPVAVLAALVLILDIKRIKVYNRDLLWLGPVISVLLYAVQLNKDAILYIIMFTIGIVSILLLRNKYSTLELALGIIQLMSALIAVTVIVNKTNPDFWVNLIGRYYNADALARMSREHPNYCNGIFFSVASTAGFLSSGFGVTLYRMKRKSGILLPLIFLGLVYTNKRAHLLFSILAFLVVYFLESGQVKKIIYIAAGAVSLIAGGHVFIVLYESGEGLANNTIRLMETLYQLFKTHDFVQIMGVRWQMFLQALDLFLQHSLFGIGWFRYTEYNAVGNATHNIYIQLLCETGIAGFILFLIPMLTEYVRTAKLLKHIKNRQMKTYLRISLYMQTFFLVYGFTGNPLYDHDFLFTYFWALAMCEMCAFRISAMKREILPGLICDGYTSWRS